MSDWKKYVRENLRPLALSSERELEIVEELAQHLEAVYDDVLATTGSEQIAYQRAAALITDWRLLECELSRVKRPIMEGWSLGEDRTRHEKGWLIVDSLLQDLRYALRMIVKKPGFTIVAVLTLALGMGANTSIYSLLDAVILRSLPVKSPEQLVRLQTIRTAGGVNGNFSNSAYRDYSEQNQVFSGLIAYSTTPLSLSGEGEAERIQGTLASGNYFSVLGVDAALGRMFLPEEDKAPGAYPVIVISNSLWKRRFGGDPAILGKSIALNNRPFTIIGVAPEGFSGLVRGLESDLWLPLMMHATAFPDDPPTALTDRGYSWLELMGRLKPGVTSQQASASMETLRAQVDQAYNRRVEERMSLAPGAKGATWLVDDLAKPLLLLMTVVGFVLVIACANVANLLIARASVRRKEIGVRLAVGAGRGRLIRQLLTESMLLALIGGLVGLFLAVWLKEFWLVFKPVDTYFPLTLKGSLDGRVLGFTFLLSLVTGLIFGSAPALQASRLDLVESLKDNARDVDRRMNVRNLLVVAQVTLSLVLLIGAGLLVKSLVKLQTVDVGFNAERVLVASLDPGLHGYTRRDGLVFYQQLLERVRGLPGVQSATLASTVTPDPGGSSIEDRIEVDGREQRTEQMVVDYNRVGPDYFQTLGIRLLRGRDFTSQDKEGGPQVVVINETMAHRLFPNEDAIGKRFRFGSREPFSEVVGVARNGRYRDLREESKLCLYAPFLMNYRHSMSLLVRTESDPTGLFGAVRREAHAIDPRIPVFNLRSLAEQVRSASAQERAAAALTGLFGVLALLLSAVGVYGVIAYTVAQRTHEIGVRMALGAQPRDVLKLMIGQGMKLTLAGAALGLCVSVAVTRLLKSMLFGVSATDPVTLIAAPVLLVGVALLACYIPARRALRIDLMTTLKYE